MSVTWENIYTIESFKKLVELKGAVKLQEELEGENGEKRVKE